MFSRTQIKDVVIAEGHIDNLSPASLPTPDHVIRLCPWDLDSNDQHGMAEQINEEFAELNQDVSFLMVKATPEQANDLVNALGGDLKEKLSSILVTDSGGLLSVWCKDDVAVFGFFDNGGSDALQSIAETAPAFDTVEIIDGWGHANFTKETLDEGYKIYNDFFNSLPEGRELQTFSHNLTSKKASLKR